MSTLWDEFDAMAYNLRQQAHSGVGEETGRALLDAAARIEQALERFPRQPSEPPEVRLAVEIEPGKHYLVGVDRTPTAEQADKLLSVLHERFPSSTFAIAVPGVSVTPDQRPELVAAVRSVGGALYTEAGKAELATYRAGLNAAAFGFTLLAEKLSVPGGKVGE
jgi:hypothetical protein